MAKLWGGRFTKGTDKAVEDFTSSIAFDARMYAEDIAGSKAHATMLALHTKKNNTNMNMKLQTQVSNS